MTKTKNNLSANLQTLMQHYALTETEISRRTQVGQPVVHRMAYGSTDNPKIKTISPIANLFGLSISQLLDELPPAEQLQVSLSDNVMFGWHPVPLVARADLAEGVAQAIKRAQQFAYSEIPPSEVTFALQCDDDSMAPQFPKNTLVIVEPALIPENEEFAVVTLSEGQPAQFRKVLYHGDDVYLQALNPAFPTQKCIGEFNCYGTMIQARVDLL